MKGHKSGIQLCALSLSLFLVWTFPAHADSILSPDQTITYPIEVVLDDLTRADVVYLGETHDRLIDHQTQLQIIQNLHRRRVQIAIGMEMFQRPFQAVLDQYIQGEISEAELQQKTEYDRRWGFPWENYAPILRYARNHQIPVLALNPPTEISRQVATQGLDGLTVSDRQWIPPISEIRTDNEAYRQFVRPIYEDAHGGHTSSRNFENFFLAQVLWDETMADRIAAFLTAHPTHQVIVLAGQGHIVYGYGIPDRVARRMGDRSGFRQRLILLNPEGSQVEEAIADYVWFD